MCQKVVVAEGPPIHVENLGKLLVMVKKMQQKAGNEMVLSSQLWK